MEPHIMSTSFEALLTQISLVRSWNASSASGWQSERWQDCCQAVSVFYITSGWWLFLGNYYLVLYSGNIGPYDFGQIQIGHTWDIGEPTLKTKSSNIFNNTMMQCIYMQMAFCPLKRKTDFIIQMNNAHENNLVLI